MWSAGTAVHRDQNRLTTQLVGCGVKWIQGNSGPPWTDYWRRIGDVLIRAPVGHIYNEKLAI